MTDDNSAYTPDDEFADAAAAVYAELLARVGEVNPQPRLEPTRRAVELLGDPQRSYPMIHVTGTNGKTSTSRMIESLLRAHGLRTGLLTSPHLVSFNERIVIDGEPISNEALAHNWADIAPYIAMVDTELIAADELPLTFFEALTVLAFASFADAPIDVAVVEVGMGGEWDSTNVADGQVAVFAPIALDHLGKLGDTIAEIARTKSGIIKPAAAVVSATQAPEAEAELARAAELTESTLAVQGAAPGFELLSSTVAVGGQLITVRGLAGTYSEHFLPLYGSHQAQNAALAIAAVESFLGGGTQAIAEDILTEALGGVTSPGRLQLVGIEPTVIVDAAHNPHGASSLVAALGAYFDFDEIAVVLGVLSDKDARGIIQALTPVATRFHVTQSGSERAIDAYELGELVADAVGEEAVFVSNDPAEALQSAREWADAAPRRAVVVTGSITLVAEAIVIADAENWMQS
ncbi:bifunctional folylpolyglutamate synthase/dihydrofolate synthase [Microterricola pindariensis]|uniref:tetrahydrofolate synthase n=1 Tax=Microterricola pindariensis TaxID=478010 RepID=A0ABX5B022_9MICO|nr:folylpolyglutamate synthase/dihydrofolate synthase family protein [Microterricola pindariensis]PPL20508.1 dihydrofolate synthase [Microterricola pindariensis]